MTSYEIAYFLIGLAIIIACAFKKSGTPGRTLKNRLPELTVGIYLLGQGVFSTLAANSAISGMHPLAVILLFVPVAAAISESHQQNRFLYHGAGVRQTRSFGRSAIR